MLYRSRARSGRKMATINRVDADAIQINGPQRDDKGDNKAIGYR